MKVLFAAVAALVLAFAPVSGAAPALAAHGYHAAYFSESAFLTLGPGETGQFSVGYTNTGTEPWIKGITGKQASLHTAAPLDNPIDHTAGWAVNWPAANIYARQANDLVTPGQIGFFVYNIKVPATMTSGSKTFYGRPSIDGNVGFMEDYGYYQVVTVATGARVTGVTPASGSGSTQPTLSGTDATANESLTVTDGASGPVVGTAFATSTGTFSIPLTSRLAAGSHTLYVNSPSKGQSAPVTYEVTGVNGPIVTAAFATGLSTVKVEFSSAMKCASSTDRTDMLAANSYFINEEPSGATGPTVSSVTASSDCKTATLTVGTLTLNKSYVVTVHFLKNSGGTNVDPNQNSGTFSTGNGTMRAVVTKQDGTATITFSRSMDITSGSTGGQSVLNPSNYTVDSTAAVSTTTTSCLLSGQNGCLVVRLTFSGGATSVLGASGTLHTIGVSNVIDAVTGGQLLSPSPSSRQVPTGQ